MAIIWVGSSIPGQELTGITTPDYIMHWAEYAVLGLLLGWWRFYRREAAKDDLQGFPVHSLMVSTLTGSIYGMVDEIHQGFVPGRCQDPRDWAADTVGAFTGALIILIMLNRFEQINAKKQSAGS